MADKCCWTNCENPAGGGTHTMIDVPQPGTTPMVCTLPVCEDHWFGNWHRDRRRLEAEIALLRHRLSAISALSSDEMGAP